MSEPVKKRILVVDDSAFMRASIQSTIATSHTYEVSGCAKDGEEAKAMCQSLLPDIITLDNILPDVIGFQLIPYFKEVHPTVKILIVSAVRQLDIVKKTQELGADGYLGKPFLDNDLLNALDGMYKTVS